MPKTLFNSSSYNSEKVNQFRARLMAQLLVIFIALTLIPLRICFAAAYNLLSSFVVQLTYRTLPFLAAYCLIVLIKYILFKKSRNWIFKYSNFIDLVFALVFTAEWVLSFYITLLQPRNK